LFCSETNEDVGKNQPTVNVAPHEESIGHLNGTKIFFSLMGMSLVRSPASSDTHGLK